MLKPRTTWRAATVFGAVAALTAMLSMQAASAAGVPTQVTLVPTTTTTTKPPQTTTSTTKPRQTTTTRKATTTTTAKGSPTTGVPSVPVGGPPTTKPRKGAPPPPPPNPTPILTAVQADLSQLSAIQDYPLAKAAVAKAQQGVTVALAQLHSAMSTQAQAQTAQKAAQQKVDYADGQLRNLAIAAYMGLGYQSPAAQEQGNTTAANGTVNSLGGLTGNAEADAQEMLRMVAQKERQNVADSKKSFKQAQHVTAGTAKLVAAAQTTVGNAESALAASQRTLSLVSQAAVTPGEAATLDLASIQSSLTSSGKPRKGPTTTTTTTTVQPPTASVSAATGLPAPTSPTILGSPTMTGAELAKWFASANRKANTTVPMAQLAADYQKAGQATGVRDDIAFAQSIVETGFFSFPAYGQLTPKDNNFAGIGACDTCAHGWSFKNALQGVTAQMELLEAYASPTPVATPLIGSVGIGGCCSTWMALAGKWASSLVYGISIMTIYHQMLTWVIPQRLVKSGLIAASVPAAKGPTLAPLPGSHA